jgi:mannose-6-phosphate isomerase
MTEPAAVPYRLDANKIPVYYAGGDRIDAFRRAAGSVGPEDWVGSTTALPSALLPLGADPTTGISRLADGASLRDVVAADPAAWLGGDLAAAYGREPGLLVKLLDAGERLPVHCHPTRETARAKLGSRFGKTEGWVIMEAVPGACVWLGFQRDVPADQLASWISAQDVDAMLAAMNRIEVAAGDVLYVPAGVAHSIGEGILLAELQEPTSFSILAEYRRFGLDETQATLGLGWAEAVDEFELTARAGTALALLRPTAVAVAVEGDAEVWRLFSAEAAPFFQAYRARVRGPAEIHPATFAVAIVVDGRGELLHGSDTTAVAAGETYVVPYALGALRVSGDLELLLCVPPAPVDPTE